MKNINFLRVIFFSILCMSFLNTYAQDEKEMTRQERKAFKKAQQAKKDEAQKILIDTLVHRPDFVLEANYLYDKRGNSYIVESDLNFISVEGDEAFVQFGSSYMVGGNGFGGTTLKGRISNYELSELKHGYSLSFDLMTSLGSLNIMIMTSETGQASATVMSNWGGRLKYSGDIKSPAESRIYKGHQRY